MTSNVLPLFWNLASSSKDVRIQASADLVSNLQGFQRSFLAEKNGDDHGSGSGSDDDDEDEQVADGAGDEDEDMEDEEEDDAESGVEVDASDDEDEGGKVDGDAAILDASLARDNAEDVAYTVKRLIRGLASSRESSRLGFALALTELLSRIQSVTASQVFSLILRNSQTNKGMKGSDERDGLFARLFGLLALIQSGSLFVPRQSTTDDAQVLADVLDCLTELGGKKGWLRESAWWGIGQALEGVLAMTEGERKESMKEKMFEAIKAEKVFSQEKLALVLRVEQAGLSSDAQAIAAPTLKHSPILSSQNLVSLARVLKGSDIADEEAGTSTSTGSWKPQLHFVWTTLMDQLLSPTKHLSGQASFPEFFRVIVDESLFANTSSPQRRYWGFQIFISALPRLTAEQMPQLFTPNFMRCWMNNLSSQDRYLHKAAQQTARIVQDVVKAHPKVGFALLSRLVGKHGRMDFDKATKTKTVEGILASLDVKGVVEYVQYLQGIVVGGSEADTNGLEDRRKWAIDQLHALCRNTSVPKSDKWVTSVLDFLAVHGFYTIRKANKKSNNLAVQSIPKPALSDATSEMCRARLFSCLVDLTSATPPRNAEASSREQGCDATGKLWLLRALGSFTVLSEDDKHLQQIIEMDEEILTARQQGLAILQRLKKVTNSSEEVVKGVEILLAYTVLQTYDDQEDMLEMLEDVRIAAERMFSLNTAQASSSSAADPEPIDMLLDTLIALLDKGSSDLKNLASMVVGLIAPAFTRSSIEHLVVQLEAAPSAEDADVDEIDPDADEEDASDVDDDLEDDGAEDDEDGDEDDEEGSSDEEVEEDDEDLPPVDPAFRRKVAAALRSAGVGIDDNGDEDEVDADDSDEEDEEVWDDEQMDKVDEQLAAVFRERVTTDKKASAKRQLMESLHFKTRILDLFDTFLRRQPENPLSIDTLLSLLRLTRNTTPTEADLANKASALIRSRVGKPKEVPSTLDVAHATQILKDIHDLARKASSADFSSLCSVCSIFVTRAIDSTDSTSQAGNDIYSATLDEFMSKKSSLVHPSFLLDYIRRFPMLAWPLHADLVKYIAPGKGVNAFRQTQAYSMLQIFSQHLAQILQLTTPEEICHFISSARSEIYATLTTVAKDAGSDWKSDRLRDVVKFGINLARSTKSVLPDQVEDLWKPDELVEVEKQLQDGKKTKEMKGVLSLVVQLKAVLGIQGGKGDKGKKGKKQAIEAEAGAEAASTVNPAVKEGKKRKSGEEVGEPKTGGTKKEKKEKKAKEAKVAARE